MTVAGAARGEMSTAGALRSGAHAAKSALDLNGDIPDLPKAEDAPVNPNPSGMSKAVPRLA